MSTKAKASQQRNFLWVLCAITLAALCLRLLVCWELFEANGGNNAVVHPSSLSDMRTYQVLAQEVAEGRFTTEFDYQPFYYSVFLAGLRLIFGGSTEVVMVAQSLLGALVVFLTGLIGARVGGRIAGITSALLTAFASTLILYTPFHLIVTLQSFWVTLLLWLTIYAADRRKWYWFALAGVVCGCAILTRGNIYFLAPALLLASFFRAPSRQAGFGFAALVLAGILIVQIPFIWRNTALKGTLTGASTASGKVLALGNTPEAPPGGRNPGLPAGPMEYPPTWHSWMATEAERPIPERILEWATQEPGAFLELNFRKALLFWDYREIPNNIGFHVDLPGSPIKGEADLSKWLNLGIISTGILLAGGLAGMLLLGKRLKRGCNRWPLGLVYYWVVAYWLGTAAFYILARFRAPILPILALFAGLFVQQLWRLRQQRRLRERVLYWGAALLAGVFFAYFANDYYRTNWEAAMMRQVRPDGIVEVMDDGRTMLLDHGPQSFGNWGNLELKRNMVIEKQFARVPEQTYSALLQLTITAEKPGLLTLEINGEVHNFHFSRPGTETREVELSQAPFDRVVIRVIGRSAPFYLHADVQRDYQRSRLNGEPLGGELIARLFCRTP